MTLALLGKQIMNETTNKKREKVIEAAVEFAERTHCLTRGHIMSTIPQQDRRYCEAMASFHIEQSAKRDAMNPRPTVHDWLEDFADEDNGDYMRDCEECGVTFRCHKRRVSPCKKCWIKFAEGVVVEKNRALQARIEAALSPSEAD